MTVSGSPPARRRDVLRRSTCPPFESGGGRLAHDGLSAQSLDPVAPSGIAKVGKVRRSRATALALLLLLSAAACTSGRDQLGDQLDSTAPSSSHDSSRSQVQGTKVPPRLTTRFGDLAERSLPVLSNLDLRQAAVSPSLRTAPLNRALLVAQFGIDGVNPAPGLIVPGVPFLLSTDGHWRRVELEEYGIDPETAAELPVALSDDGARLALGRAGRPGRIVVIDIATGKGISHPLPARFPAGLQWSPDGGEIRWFNRNVNSQSYILDVTSGESRKLTGYAKQGAELAASYWGTDDRMIEVLADPKGAGAVLRVHEQDTQVDHALEYPDLIATWPPVLADELVVWHYRDHEYERGAAALVAVDPTDGSLAGALTHSNASTYWARPEAWVHPHELVFSDFPQTNIYLWSVTDRNVTRIGGFRHAGAIIDISPDMARRLLAP